jgi:hypothetical protein
MEAIYDLFSGAIIIIPILMIIMMESRPYQKPPSQEKIDSYQEELDKESQALFKHFGIERKFNARYELLRERRQQKIFIGFNMATVYLSALMFFSLANPGPSNLKIALFLGIFITVFFAIFSGIKPQLKKLTGST